MSDTPRTDAHTRQLIDTLQHPHWIEFARTLERENATLRKDKERLDWLLSFNGCTWLYWALGRGQLKPALSAIRAAIDEAREEQP